MLASLARDVREPPCQNTPDNQEGACTMGQVGAGQPSFAALLRQHRRAAGLSQEALADCARLSLRGINDLERGERRHPRAETVDLLATALGLDLAQHAALLDRSRQRHPNRDLSAETSGSGHAQPMPLALTSFVGRRREIGDIERLLGLYRLLTITGPGGCGKTRLALEIARARTETDPGAVAVVELAALTDPGLIPETVRAALGRRDKPGKQVIETLREVLASKPWFLVLDNCEHLVDAAARFVETLLQSCPDLRVLATSRENLGIPGEVA
jgi:transcriptional regulator with XRE-family HTH domain